MRGLIVLLGLACALPASASTRDEEIAQCRPGERVTWNDGRDGPAVGAPLLFVYEPAGAPAGFGRAEVGAAIERAAAAWAGCGVPAQVLGLGQAAPSAGAIRVRWNDAAAAGVFGLADVGRRTLSLSPAAFALLRQRNPAYPAGEILQMTISHEMGHFFGLMAHSRRCVDVMSYYTDGKGGRCASRDPNALQPGRDYRALLPTACDLERCRAANR